MPLCIESEHGSNLAFQVSECPVPHFRLTKSADQWSRYDGQRWVRHELPVNIPFHVRFEMTNLLQDWLRIAERQSLCWHACEHLQAPR
jgi:hypothetical protein